MEGRLHFQLASDQCGFKNVGKASVPRKSNVLLQREKVKMCVWVIPDAVHSAASDLLGLGFAFSSYFLSVVISYLHNLVFAFLQLPVPVAVAINGPTSSDAFRMGPSLWTLFAAHAQLQPSTPRLVWNGLLSSLAFGLRWLTAFVSWACHAGNPCYLPGTLCEMYSIGRTKWQMEPFFSTIQCLCCVLDVHVPCLAVLCSTVLSTTKAALFVFQWVLVFHFPSLNKMATAHLSGSWLNFFCGVWLTGDSGDVQVKLCPWIPEQLRLKIYSSSWFKRVPCDRSNLSTNTR